MIFSTYQFIFLFLPITFFVYFFFNHFKYYSIAKIWLAVASLYFYGQGSPDFFVFFLASVTGNYLVGSCLGRLDGEQKGQKKLLLFIGVMANVALLGYYKYTDFFIENFNALTGTDFALKHIVLPIGISFFTFQLIAFLVDAYRGETRQYDFINYLLFITFFPQLIVGPIIHHGEVVPQFEDEKNLKLNYDNIAKGLDGVQNAVGAGISLNQSVHLQVFIHPQCVERGGVKAGQKHIDYNEKIQFFILHPQGYIFVVVLKLIPVGRIIGMEHFVVIPDGFF